MLCKCYLELARFRLTALVLTTTAVGYLLAAPRPLAGGGLLWTVLGTGLAAIGASTFNQILEVDRDAQMLRTRQRPLPAGRISRGHALAFAVVTTVAGLGVLNELVNPLTALLGLVNVLLYTLVYTPLKPRTSLNTLVGAICGALPPIMGWTGAASQLTLGAGLLGAILFLWQVPHFLALSWLYRADYARAGYRMLPVIDPSGRLTCLLIVLYSLALLPLGLSATFCGMASYLFGALSLVLGVGFFLLALQLRTAKTDRNARRLFLASIIYLPLLLLFLLADARPVRAEAGLAAQTAPRVVDLPLM